MGPAEFLESGCGSAFRIAHNPDIVLPDIRLFTMVFAAVSSDTVGFDLFIWGRIWDHIGLSIWFDYLTNHLLAYPYETCKSFLTWIGHVDTCLRTAAKRGEGKH